MAVDGLAGGFGARLAWCVEMIAVVGVDYADRLDREIWQSIRVVDDRFGIMVADMVDVLWAFWVHGLLP